MNLRFLILSTAAAATLTGTDWQEVVFAPADFKNKKGEGLVDSSTVQILGFAGLPEKASPSVQAFRNLRWIVP